MTQIKKYTKKDGSTAYGFNVYVGRHPQTGKNVYRKRQGFKTNKQAQIALADVLKDVEENGIVQKKEVVTTFNDLYEMFYQQHEMDVKPTTSYNTRRFYKAHIKPHFGDLNLKDISVVHCQKIVNGWHKKGLKMTGYLRQLTSQIIRYGESMELMVNNPMSKTILPRRKNEEKKLQFYTKEELTRFFECLKNEGNMKQQTFFRLLAFSGARKGEIMALQ